MSSPVVPPKSTAPMTPSAFMALGPISPPSPAQVKATTDESLSDDHLEELNRWKRRPRRESDTANLSIASRPRRASSVPLRLEEQTTAEAARHGHLDGNESTPSEFAKPGSQAYPQTALADLDSNGEREWKQRLFECFESDASNWLTAFCCPCVSFGEIRYREEHLEDPEMIETNKWCSTTCWAHYCLAVCTQGLDQAIWAGITRHDTRQKLNINGDTLNDIFAVLCCYCCEYSQRLTQVQHDRQLLLEKKQMQQRSAAEYGQHPQTSYAPCKPHRSEPMSAVRPHM